MSSLPTKEPGDPFPYERLSESGPFDSTVVGGKFVYVQDADGVVWIAEDGNPRHPKLLGGAVAAAGELVLYDGVIVEVNNVSGTFQCDPDTLPQVIEALQSQGGTVASDAVRPFRWEN
jgi:hypothetical protein